MSSATVGPRALFGLACAALVLVLGFSWADGPLFHDDLFLHLGTGKHVVEHHEVPTTDRFSFTRYGEPWVSHEWGFGAATYLVWRVAGYGGLVWLKALLVVATLGFLMLLMVRRSGPPWVEVVPVAAGFAALGLWAIEDQLILRASLFSSFFVLLLLVMLDRFERQGSRWAFAGVVLLFLLWGNFHGEVIFGLFVLGVATSEAVLGRLPGERQPLPEFLLQRDPSRPYVGLLVASLIATQLNPNGYRVVAYPFRLAAFLLGNREGLDLGHFGAATTTDAPAFYLIVVLLLIAALPLERLKALSLTDAITITAFLILSLRSHRFIVFFCLFALPALALLLGMRVATWLGSLSAFRRLLIAIVPVTVVVSAIVVDWRRQDDRLISRHFPAASVELIEQEIQRTEGDTELRLFNHQNYGGYLRWTLDQPVYWDGRNLVFASLMTETRGVPLEELTHRWKLDGLLFTEYEIDEIGAQIDPSRWGLVHWDDFAALYLRRTEEHRRVLDQFELVAFPPFGGVDGLNVRARDEAWVTAAREELDQVLRREPRCQRALYFLGLISFYRGELDRAEDELRRALAIGEHPNVRRALVRLLER